MQQWGKQNPSWSYPIYKAWDNGYQELLFNKQVSLSQTYFENGEYEVYGDTVIRFDCSGNGRLYIKFAPEDDEVFYASVVQDNDEVEREKNYYSEPEEWYSD